MGDKIIAAPFVKTESIDDIPHVENPISGKILYSDGSGGLKTAEISVFKDIIVTGVYGEAKPGDSPTPYDPAEYPDGLYEKWDINTAGTYTNFLISPGNPVVVTVDDLKNNFVQIWVTNGVSEKILSAKLANTAKQIFDPANNADPSTMKSAAERWDPANKTLQFFLTQITTTKTEIAMPQSGETPDQVRNTGGTTSPTVGYGAWGIIPMAVLAGQKRIRLEGGQSENGAGCVYLAKQTAAGWVNLISGNSTVAREVDIDQAALAYRYSRFTGTVDLPNNPPTRFYKISETAVVEADAVKKYIDAVNASMVPTKDVLSGFLHPTQEVWEEITIPAAGGTTYPSTFYNSAWSQQSGGASLEAGTIPNAIFGTEWTKIKMVGDFTILGAGGGWLGQYRSNGITSLLTGNKGSYAEFIFPLDTSGGKLGFVYSRQIGNHKFYRGKTVQLTPTPNSVMEMILSKSASLKHRMIDAYTDYGVSPTATAAENAARLNAAMLDAYTRRVPIYMPSGIIKITKVTLMPGIHMHGCGLEATTFEGTTAGNMFELLDVNNNQAFWEGNIFSNMTIDGANIADVGINMRNSFGLLLDHIRIRRCKVYGADYEGVLAPRFRVAKFQEGLHGIRIRATFSSSVGYMQANMCDFNNCWFVVLSGYGAILERASLVTFYQCDFERVGTTGDLNTGGILAKNLSPGGQNNTQPEGVDVIIQSCWSEGLHGPLLTLVNCRGISKIDGTMCGNPGDTTTVKIINDGSILKIEGSKINYTATGVLTKNNGKTFTDGISEINNHVENTGGTFKTTQYI